MIPKVDELLKSPDIEAEISQYSREFIATILREVLEEVREEIHTGKCMPETKETLKEDILARIVSAARSSLTSPLIPVINATGVVVHTNLGRSPYPVAALKAIENIAPSYSNLEFDLEKGARGNRDEVVEKVLRKIFPGTGALVVNNNAAAVLLVLNTLAEGKEVIVSRGQLVEIGGSFRIPDVMDKSGALIREVGTTNKTHYEDYVRAISERTGLILIVHPSNFKVIGFSSTVEPDKIAGLGREKGIPVVEDMGSGNFLNLTPFGIKDEPTVQEHLAMGIDLVTFSGDKLLGGPQAGFIVGREDLIAQIRKNHLRRALRLCKTIYAAVSAVLLEYLKGTARENIPVMKMIHITYEEMEARTRALKEKLDALPGILAEIERDGFKIGGGAAPDAKIPTPVLALETKKLSVDACLRKLRSHRPPIIARARENRVILDLRTVFPEQEDAICAALQSLETGNTRK